MTQHPGRFLIVAGLIIVGIGVAARTFDPVVGQAAG